MKAFTLSSIAALAGLSAAIPFSQWEKRATGLDVSLSAVGNTEVTVKVTNSGADDLNLLAVGSLLDESPVEKLKVVTADKSATFLGIKKRVATEGLTADAFKLIAAGESIEFNVDVAAVHDVAAGGAFSAFAQGALAFAAADSTELIGAVGYSSNTLELDIDGEQASKVVKAIDVNKRSVVNADCTGTQRTATINALTQCANLASQYASQAAAGTSAAFTSYFKTSSNAGAVSRCLSTVRAECASTTSGSTTSHCRDTYGGCSSNVLAYTVPSVRFIANCPLYFSALPALTRTCHAQDQATTTLHEMTHAVCGTDDLAYGDAAAKRLSAASSVNNADSYALFINALYSGCS